MVSITVDMVEIEQIGHEFEEMANAPRLQKAIVAAICKPAMTSLARKLSDMGYTLVGHRTSSKWGGKVAVKFKIQKKVVIPHDNN